jgi:hypothetical protein
MSRRPIHFALIAACLASCTLPYGLIGSGARETRSFALEGFSALDICCGMQVVLSGGDDFAVSITADENALSAIRARVVDGTLRLELDPGQGGSFVTGRLEAQVTMPVLEALTLSGGAQLRLGDSAPQAGDLRLEAHGGSQAHLSGLSTQRAQVTLSGGAYAELAVSEDIAYDLSGGAHLDYTGEPSISRAVTSGGASASRN